MSAPASAPTAATAADAERRRAWTGPLAVWAGLLALLALNLGAVYAPLGGLRTAAHFALAALMVAVVATGFMRLGRASNLVRLAAVAGLLWSCFLFLLVGADYLART